ncbi:MAG: DUF1292 domain-containing protein [Erysipelotrichaceae bacterium]|nr:DUF1292 domain-containing protein [Erysipelotrichaceae bacterium]
MDEFNNMITLTDANGNDKQFEFLDLIAYDNEEYVVLLEDDPDANEVVILKLEDGDTPDTESYISVDDDQILQSVFEIFKENNADIFDFEG